MLLSHGGSQYHLRSRTVRGIPGDHLKRLRSIWKKPRVSNPKPPKLGDEVEQEAVGGDADTEVLIAEDHLQISEYGSNLQMFVVKQGLKAVVQDSPT